MPTGGEYWTPIRGQHSAPIDIPTLADIYTDGARANVPVGDVQLIAADDVAEMLLDAALSSPVNGDVEIAGPERAPMNEVVERYLNVVGDPRKVVADPGAGYFGALLQKDSLVPHGHANTGKIAFDRWMNLRNSR